MLGRRILLSLVVVLGICWLFFSVWIVGREKSLAVDRLRAQAEEIYNYVELTRHWIAYKSGIYVKDKDGYHLVTPYNFEKDLSHYAKGRLLYKVRVAMMTPETSSNPPDEFEAEAIQRLRHGEDEVWRLETTAKGEVFRFAAPLVFTQECANCHRSYLNGAPACISISLPANTLFHRLRQDRIYLFLSILVFMAVLFFILMFLLKVWVLEPLSEFVGAFRRMSDGDLSVRMDEEREDEWGELAKYFNLMGDKMAHHRQEMKEEVKRAVAEMEKAYRDLKETESFKSEFFSNITHDLKTPITAIKGAADLLARKEGVVPYIEVIRKNAEKLSKMIGDLLDCARLDSGKLEINLEEQDLVEVVEETIFTTTLLAKQKNVTIRVESERDTVMVPVDTGRISQVVANLLSNAIKFSPEGGEVVVRVEVADSWAVVSVEDFGPGIPEAERGKVFEKFYRGRNGEASEGSTGLGLAICKGIVEAHGGRIEIIDPGHQGTLVRFFLPGVKE